MENANEEERATNAADNVGQLFRVPQVWPKNIKLWFVMLETYFKVTHITSDQTKFTVLIEYLWIQYLDQVEGIMIGRRRRENTNG